MHTCKECSGERKEVLEYVVGYLFNSTGTKVALIRKNYPEWQKGKLNGIGGKLQEVGYVPYPVKTWPTSFILEIPVECMRREFKEEAGVDIPEENWEHFLTVEKNSRETGQPIVLYMFRCFSTERLQQAKTSSQEGEVLVVPIVELPYLPVIDSARILLALEDRRKFTMREFN